jgi:hypothetical protein
VLWIRHISVRIRIRIRGSVPLTYRSGFGSCFLSVVDKISTRIFFFKVFLFITFWRYIFVSLQRQKVKKISQNSRNQGFLLLVYGKILIRTNNNGSGSRRPKNIRIRFHNTGYNTCTVTEMLSHLKLFHIPTSGESASFTPCLIIHGAASWNILYSLTWLVPTEILYM